MRRQPSESSRIGPARYRRDSGASLVEFAIMAPVLFALLFGIIDFGSSYNDWISVRQGAREGARQVVVGNAGASSSCDLGGDAATASEVTRRAFCLVKDRVGLDDPDVRVAIRFEDDEHEVERSMSVCVAYPARSITGFFSSLLEAKDVVLRTEVQMRIERLFGNDGNVKLDVDREEDYPYGGDWSWCVAETTAP